MTFTHVAAFAAGGIIGAGVAVWRADSRASADLQELAMTSFQSGLEAGIGASRDRVRAHGHVAAARLLTGAQERRHPMGHDE